MNTIDFNCPVCNYPNEDVEFPALDVQGADGELWVNPSEFECEDCGKTYRIGE